MDLIKKSNVNITKQIVKSNCIDNGECPASMDEVFSTGKTGPYEQYRVEDYFYRQIDGGKDCLVTTVLTNKENYTEFCFGDNLKYFRYKIDPYMK